jgi:hypothetical protein
MTASAVADFRDLDHRGYEFKREHFARVARSFGNPRSTNLLNLMHRARTPTQPKASLRARSAESWGMRNSSKCGGMVRNDNSRQWSRCEFYPSNSRLQMRRWRCRSP